MHQQTSDLFRLKFKLNEGVHFGHDVYISLGLDKELIKGRNCLTEFGINIGNSDPCNSHRNALAKTHPYLVYATKEPLAVRYIFIISQAVVTWILMGISRTSELSHPFDASHPCSWHRKNIHRSTRGAQV